ncbi:DUF6320 domain-containing protein [Sediminivirga luteola]|uniref:Zinc ribbon domain-containing protein n=1 Tax=Sediminivirga luteola TaxID=1774748 RepID=A0A8J2TWJ8_9MICO|nr:DUF6320 domain-containing protein [Sediminivirga luteola]MCI2266566.1 DUF6320 domain-containing protein [Sediminivirga luteola]GGA07942.1 hypothetical protein GCM10011333_08430 [Sediminivirga luteola]
MRHCSACGVDVEGPWTRCPLCATALTGQAAPGPFPVVPLRFSRRRVLRMLALASIAVVLVSFAVQLLFGRDPAGIGVLRSVILGVGSMWLVVLMAVGTRRNVAKGTVYLVVLTGLVCVYWDYLTGWHGWSLAYAVPIVCACSVIALAVTVRVMRIEVGEHILYSALTVVLGLVPLVFLALDWVRSPLPSAICGALSCVVLALFLLARGPEMRHELAKRLHL